jgi:hypothetical protein
MRRLLGLLIVGGFILALSGCGGSIDQAEPAGDRSSIRVSENISATRQVMDLSRSSIGGGFTKMTVYRNPATGTAMKESYIHGSSLSREAEIGIDGYGTGMKVESSFDGMATLGVYKISDPNSTAKDSPIFAASESYYGSFSISEKIDDRGSSISSERAVFGTGFVAVDKKVGDDQRSRESGTGSYRSEELIDTRNNYISKSISLIHQPTSFTVGSASAANLSSRWREGVTSRAAGESYIGEEYSSIDRLDKTTVARGLGAMETEADFSGTARYRVVSPGKVDMDEQYQGDYALQRKVQLQRAGPYHIPHLSVTKVGVLSYQGDKTLASYVITIENDGDRTLEPVLVRDLFPPGSAFVSSDQRPAFTSGGAEWSFTHISPGDVLTIDLVLDVTGFRGGDLVNRVEAWGGLGEDLAYAANYSSIEINWLSWGSGDGIAVSKRGAVDEAAPNRVRYTLEVEYLGDGTLVATVTDRLPQGMSLVASSPTFAASEGGVVRWNLIDLAPKERRTIVYDVDALWSGRFLNLAEVEARSVDGISLRPVTARSVVDLAKFDGERQRPGWQPPEWGFGEADEGVLSIF